MSRHDRKLAKSATIVDVARLAGVSKSTVSNVIRNANCVTPEMRARVAEAVSTLGHRPRWRVDFDGPEGLCPVGSVGRRLDRVDLASGGSFWTESGGHAATASSRGRRIRL